MKRAKLKFRRNNFAERSVRIILFLAILRITCEIIQLLTFIYRPVYNERIFRNEMNFPGDSARSRKEEFEKTNRRRGWDREP